MKNNYSVYMHISPSNKRYIGITCQKNIKKRWGNGKGYKKNKHFYRAIEKYDWNNFEHIIIAKGLDKDTACWLEIELIKVWDATNKEKGYNINPGGNMISDKQRKEHSLRMTGESNPMYGKHHTEETKEKLSLCFKGRERSEEWCNNISKGKKGKLTGESNPMYGKHHTEETRKDISKNRIENGIAKGKNNPRATQIICIENEIIFDTIKDASLHFNISYSYLVTCIKKKKICKGYTFLYYEDYLKMNGEIDNEV